MLKATVFDGALQATNEQGFRTAKQELNDNRLISFLLFNAFFGHKIFPLVRHRS